MNRNILLVFAPFFFYFSALGQGGEWTWVKGGSYPNALAVYGAKGVPSQANTPQGLAGSAYWPDQQGNFWIYGGFDGDLNVPCALWRYNPFTNTWTWMSGKDSVQEQDIPGPGAPNYGTRGVAASTNFPGARVWSTQWTDNNGNLWLFGGSGWDSTGYPVDYDDLWEYNTTSNLWTWVWGPDPLGGTDVYGTFQQPADSNMPGGRYSAGASWVDAANNLWFFGGAEGNTSFNDMWRYNISTGQWTWMNGPQGGGDAGSYGVKDVESATNRPPHRVGYTRWKDACGNFYLWGGGDYWISDIQHDNKYSDVWKYDVNTNYWVWIAGEDTGGSSGNYTSICLDTGNTGTHARTFNSTAQFLGATNTFYGYAGYYDRGANPALDDLWLFNSNNNQWKWIGGQQGTNIPATYGNLGIPSVSNLPGSRYQNCMWVDSSGNLWMFGGEGDTAYHMFNDVWRFIPDTSCTGNLLAGGSAFRYQLSSNTICNGGHITLSLSGISNAAVTPSASVTWTDSAQAWLNPSSTTTYTLTGQTGCTGNDTVTFTITVAPISAQITASALVFCPNDSTSICATSPFASYYWNTGDTTMCIDTKNAGNYYVTVTDAGGCSAVSNQITVSNYVPTPVTLNVAGDTLSCYGETAYQWYRNGQIIPGDTASTIVAAQPGNYSVEITDSSGCQYYSSAAAITGIEYAERGATLTVYPNPLSAGNWHLQADDSWLGAKTSILDINGQVIYTSVLNNLPGEILLEASPGVYELQVAKGDRSTCVKLVKF